MSDCLLLSACPWLDTPSLLTARLNATAIQLLIYAKTTFPKVQPGHGSAPKARKS